MYLGPVNFYQNKKKKKKHYQVTLGMWVWLEGVRLSTWPLCAVPLFSVLMSVFHDEVEIEDFEYDEDSDTYYYPCPCGDQFQITRVSIGQSLRFR